MSIVLATELIKKLKGRRVDGVWLDVLDELAVSDDFTTLLAVHDSWTLCFEDICIRVDTSNKVISHDTALPDGIVVTDVHQVETSIHVDGHLSLLGSVILLVVGISCENKKFVRSNWNKDGRRTYLA